MSKRTVEDILASLPENFSIIDPDFIDAADFE